MSIFFVLTLFFMAHSLIERYSPNHSIFTLTEDTHEKICRAEMESYVKNDERKSDITSAPEVPDHLRHLVNENDVLELSNTTRILREIAEIHYRYKDSPFKAEVELNMHDDEDVFRKWKELSEEQRSTMISRYAQIQKNEQDRIARMKSKKESEFIATHPILRPPALKFLDKMVGLLQKLENFNQFLQKIPILGKGFGFLLGDSISKITTFVGQMNEVIQKRASVGDAMLNVVKHHAKASFNRMTSDPFSIDES